jgi:RNA polymerase sigma-70 factor (ECF subfamily)
MKAPAPAAATRQNPQEAADPDLMRALAAGDLGALGALYDRHQDAVRQFLRRAAADPAEVDDLLHETFLTVPRAAARYDGRPQAASFLIGIAATLVRRRRRFLSRWAEILHEVATGWPGAVSTPEEVARHTEDLGALDEALARMSERKRLVYLMIEREEMSGEEVAQALGIPLGTVWTRLHHARTALERALLRRSKR